MSCRFLLIFLGLTLCVQAQQETSLREVSLISTGANQLAPQTVASLGPVTVPAGTIYTSEDGKCVCLVLKTAVGSDPIVVATWPNSPATGTKWTLSQETPAQLAPLVQYVQKAPDASAEALQLTALCLMSDPTYRQWETSLAPESKLAAALEAIVILREIAPDKSFHLQGDNELKLIALRTPGLRGKAMQAFRVTLPSTAVNTKTLPTIGQLMHQAPGDNCPLCRAREKAGKDNL